MAAQAASAPPLNMIHIIADDVGYDDLSCFGAKEIKTPNLDRLAATGITFTDFYAPQAGYRQPGTLRTAVFLCGAILGRSGRQAVLHLSTVWGGLDKHKPLLDGVLHWPESTSPKLDRAGPAPCGSEGFLQQNPVPT